MQFFKKSALLPLEDSVVGHVSLYGALCTTLDSNQKEGKAFKILMAEFKRPGRNQDDGLWSLA